MELLQLQYFRTVAKLEHMTKAAQQLHIAQPALSKTIARLEENIGVPLFDRNGRSIRLNAFGKAFLVKVDAALTLLEEGRKEAVELAGLEHGSIHLATSTLDRLSDPLAAFLNLHPKVNFRITQASTEEMTHLLESGDVDIGFTALPIEGAEFDAATVLNEDVYLAVPPGHRLAELQSVPLHEVANDPFIGYKEGLLFQPMNDAFLKKAGISPHFVCRVDEPSAIANLVRAGLGVALVGGCGRDVGVQLPLLRIEEPICQRNFQVVWHKKRYLSIAARKLRDYIIQYYADSTQEV
ncbi:LysR family transcriptional regulator [Paenibacillus sp. SC116]|uniref:LysR family transcriptional regulator n=1 Tax=Paenibacillus sp. SC116 TaxID=2968986 RepID=UPI00215B7238|nr:LysR family transcriptional regulator [Paenibacillus sp. SC116]MCR8842636.1 LysR family transcriptional regulator [Paenibacillus sp. SC116]